jgi:cold shock CspA family protein
MADTFNKKENEKKKQQKKKEKEERKAERKAHAKPGQALEDMLAYVDENGNLSSTPPDPTRKKVIREDDIVTGSRNIGGNTSRQGRIAFFNSEKNYGFIKEDNSDERVFVHGNDLSTMISEGDAVTFDVRSGLKGFQAVNVKKI